MAAAASIVAAKVTQRSAQNGRLLPPWLLWLLLLLLLLLLLQGNILARTVCVCSLWKTTLVGMIGSLKSHFWLIKVPAGARNLFAESWYIFEWLVAVLNSSQGR
jgi:hypothetical protein